MTIGERISSIRSDSGLSQSEFAVELSTSQSHISNIEKGKKGLSVPLRKLICFTFSVNEEWLLTGEGEKYNSSIQERLDALVSYYDGDDKNALKKLDAIEAAAELYAIYPSISLSCESVNGFLSLFKDDEFCKMFNIVVLAYRHQRELLEGQEMYTFLKTAICLSENQVVMPLDKEIQEKSLKDFSENPTSKYLADLKNGIMIEANILEHMKSHGTNDA